MILFFTAVLEWMDMVKNKLIFFIYFLIGCATHEEHPVKIQKQLPSEKDYPIRIKNLTPNSYQRTQDDRYAIRLKITDKSALKGNFYAEAVIDGLSYQMKYAGNGEFVYYHQIGCVASFEVQFRVYYTSFTLFPVEDVKYEVYHYPKDGAQAITINPSTREIVASRNEVIFSCKDICEACFADNLAIINKGLSPVAIREITIEQSSLIEDNCNASGEGFNYYLRETLPVSIDCGEGVVLSISHKHTEYKTLGTLAIKTDNPKQPEIKIHLAGRCTKKIASRAR